MMDPHGEIKSRWPTHIPAVSDDPRGFKRIGRALAPYFTDEEIEGIMGENAWRFFERHLPPS
jgi:microsomal dipeptidase-like Zn-dependent dipeptidase